MSGVSEILRVQEPNQCQRFRDEEVQKPGRGEVAAGFPVTPIRDEGQSNQTFLSLEN